MGVPFQQSSDHRMLKVHVSPWVLESLAKEVDLIPEEMKVALVRLIKDVAYTTATLVYGWSVEQVSTELSTVMKSWLKGTALALLGEFCLVGEGKWYVGLLRWRSPRMGCLGGLWQSKSGCFFVTPGAEAAATLCSCMFRAATRDQSSDDSLYPCRLL